MKLVIAIVQDEDTDALTQALVAAGHRFTKVSTTGSFLRTGNSSLLIGVEDSQVANVMNVLRRTCRRRTQIATGERPTKQWTWNDQRAEVVDHSTGTRYQMAAFRRGRFVLADRR